MATKIIREVCIHCGNLFTFEVNEERYNKWRNGEMLIQDALRNVSPDHRELLISGVCGSCFTEMTYESD